MKNGFSLIERFQKVKQNLIVTVKNECIELLQRLEEGECPVAFEDCVEYSQELPGCHNDITVLNTL
jgi:hypothetical protein